MSGRRGLFTAGCRLRTGRARGSRLPAGVVHQVFQFLAGLEIGDPFGRNLDARTGLRISPHAWLSLPGAKTPKSPDFDFVPRPQGSNDAVEDSFYDHLGILTGHFHD